MDRNLIASRAYAIWQKEGCPAGCDWRHWFQAEVELRAECGQCRTYDPYTFEVPADKPPQAKAPAAAH